VRTSWYASTLERSRMVVPYRRVAFNVCEDPADGSRFHLTTRR
jgi:hypothetical protein